MIGIAYAYLAIGAVLGTFIGSLVARKDLAGALPWSDVAWRFSVIAGCFTLAWPAFLVDLWRND